MAFLEEMGATGGHRPALPGLPGLPHPHTSLRRCWCAGNKGLIALHTNPVLADSTAGLATTATAFAAIEVRPAQLQSGRWARHVPYPARAIDLLSRTCAQPPVLCSRAGCSLQASGKHGR